MNGGIIAICLIEITHCIFNEIQSIWKLCVLKDASENAWLCVQCAAELAENSIVAEEIR